MRIDSLSSYGGLYGNYKAQSIPQVSPETVREQDAQRLAKQNQMPAAVQTHNEATEIDSDTEQRLAARSRSANLEDVSLSLHPADDFSHIGSEADPGLLDMEKAISDMHKDQVLEQYQYFVGNAQNMGNEDGVVILK